MCVCMEAAQPLKHCEGKPSRMNGGETCSSLVKVLIKDVGALQI